MQQKQRKRPFYRHIIKSLVVPVWRWSLCRHHMLPPNKLTIVSTMISTCVYPQAYLIHIAQRTLVENIYISTSPLYHKRIPFSWCGRVMSTENQVEKTTQSIKNGNCVCWFSCSWHHEPNFLNTSLFINPVYPRYVGPYFVPTTITTGHTGMVCRNLLALVLDLPPLPLVMGVIQVTSPRWGGAQSRELTQMMFTRETMWERAVLTWSSAPRNWEKPASG